jgi:hypothetical protein
LGQMRADHERILRKLQFSPLPLASHEIHIDGMSINTIATRLPEMYKLGYVDRQIRKGTNFKEWWPKREYAGGQFALPFHTEKADVQSPGLIQPGE